MTLLLHRSEQQISPDTLIEYADRLRRDAGRKLDAQRRIALGQFMTPASIARLMASMLRSTGADIALLDAGAGTGMLLSAAVAELCRRPQLPEQIRVTAYEVDAVLLPYLRDSIERSAMLCNQMGIVFSSEIIATDFIAHASEQLSSPLFVQRDTGFHCAILNPPYRKIQTASATRRDLRRVGIETSNLYTGFLSLAIHLLAPGGELIAITPRSFCNGPYFRPFRELLLQEMALCRFHLFESREEAFRDDAVLQENIILAAVKSPQPMASITISTSTSTDDEMHSIREAPYDQVVHPGDPQSFIHLVPDAAGTQIKAQIAKLKASLADLGLTVSTGRVVDFRAAAFLRAEPANDTVALIYPTHIVGDGVSWPKPASKKPNALVHCDKTSDLCVPNDYYVLIKRFSAKEERKRVVAAVYDPGRVPGAVVGFENHLNYIHRNGAGLDPVLARGLAAFLNSTLVDSYVRQFNGHTQVNATDLRNLRYPTYDQLLTLGARVGEQGLSQDALDAVIAEELGLMDTTTDSTLDPI